MKHKDLQHHASNCQIAADEMAFKMIKQNKISVAQSVCDFNLSWLYQISPEVLIHIDSIDFIIKHIREFKRKIKLKEMIRFDSIIYHNEPKNFTEFVELFKT